MTDNAVCYLLSSRLNELFILLEKSNKGLKTGTVFFTAPTQADDIVLLSLSKKNVEILLGILQNYSKKWRYVYNADKSVVIVFNEHGTVQIRIWVFGD